MPGPDDGLGKKAEGKIKLWLDDPSSGYSFDRIPDQMSGMYMVSRNICDFICFKSPNQYYIESKATWHDRFDFSMISDNQYEGLMKKSMINGCYGLIIILFGTYKRAFILDIRDIDSMTHRRVGNLNEEFSGKTKNSVNINKLDSWPIPSIEIPTVKSRKMLLDYSGDFQTLVNELETKR